MLGRPLLQQRAGPLAAIAFAARGLRRRPQEIFILEQAFQPAPMDDTPPGPDAITIHGLSSLREQFNNTVEQGIGGPHIKGQNPIGLGRRRKPGDVRDASEIQNQPVLIRRSKHPSMEEWRQGRPLPSGCDIPRTKVADHPTARPLRDQGQRTDLQRSTDLGVVDDCLAM